MQRGRARTSGLGVPPLLLTRLVGWCARPMGCWFFPVPRPPYVCTCLRYPGPLGSCSLFRPLSALLCLCGVLGHLAPVHRCARSVRCFACVVSWATELSFTGVPARCVALHLRCPGPLGLCSSVRLLAVLFCVRGVLGHLALVHRCARSVCCFASAVSWATWLLFTGAPAQRCLCVRCPGPLGSCSAFCPLCEALLVRCPGPLGSCSPVCPLGALLCLCGVLGYGTVVHRCARSVRCFACAVSWATLLLFTGAPARCVVLRARCPGPLGSCSPVYPLGVLWCVYGVLGHLPPVDRSARLVCCFACAVSWATWLLFTGVPARCVACVGVVLGHLAPVHPCARSACCVASAVSWATWLLLTGVPTQRCLCVRCPGRLGSRSPVCPLGVLCCVYGVLGHLAPVDRCARLVRFFACAVSWATWLLFTSVPARCVACVLVVLGHLAPVYPCARSACCVASAVSWATWLLFTGVPARYVACVCGVLRHLAPVHRCARSVRCFACAVWLATWLLFTSVPARRVALRVRCPGPLGSCSPVCLPDVLPVCAVSWATWLLFTAVPAWCVACVCGVLGHLALVHRCARSACCVAFAVSWATRLLFTGVPARCVALRVRCPGPLGSCSPVCPVGVLPVCAVSWATLLLFTGVPARCVVLLVRRPGPLGSCSPMCPLGALPVCAVS